MLKGDLSKKWEFCVCKMGTKDKWYGHLKKLTKTRTNEKTYKQNMIGLSFSKSINKLINKSIILSIKYRTLQTNVVDILLASHICCFG